MTIVPHSILDKARDEYSDACQQAKEAEAEYTAIVDQEYVWRRTADHNRVQVAADKMHRANDRRQLAYANLQLAHILVGAVPSASYEYSTPISGICDNVRG